VGQGRHPRVGLGSPSASSERRRAGPVRLQYNPSPGREPLGEQMQNHVVAHFIDGRVVKGQCFDLSMVKPVCHVQQQGGGALEVRLTELKALFFVKDLEGDPARQEANRLETGDRRGVGARPMEVRFQDGEVLNGFVTGYAADRPFFFMVPADPDSNNTRIFVNRAAVARVAPLP
jgi:hypothetical protein